MGITQYISCVDYHGLYAQKEQIKDRTVKFYEEKVREHIPLDSFVIDVLVLGIRLDEEHELNLNVEEKQQDDGIYIIELNPFYKSAGAGLFDWKTDRELFLNGPCEIRVRDGPDPKGTDYFHVSWNKSFTRYKEQTQVRRQRKCIVL